MKYPCNQCSYQASRKNDLSTHFKSIHEGVKYPCNLCEFETTHKGNLSTHKKVKHTGIYVKFSSNQCEFKATQKVQLQSHIRSKHMGIKYPSKQCDYIAAWPVALNKSSYSRVKLKRVEFEL